MFAALDVATGRVIGTCYARHRAVEFRNFLDEIEARVPPDLDVHLVMNNYATLTKKQIRRGTHRSVGALQDAHDAAAVLGGSSDYAAYLRDVELDCTSLDDP